MVPESVQTWSRDGRKQTGTAVRGDHWALRGSVVVGINVATIMDDSGTIGRLPHKAEEP